MSGRQRQSRFERGDDVVVMKFGGTSVEDADAIRRLIGIVQSGLGAQPVLVVSALAGVTDQLLEAGAVAANGHLGLALATVRNIYVRHEELADSLAEGSALGALDRDLRGELQALESLLHDLEASHQLDLKSQDHLLGFGERFSSRLVKEALSQAGIHAAHVDASQCIVTDARHGQASPMWDATNQRLQETLSPLLECGQVPVLGGFIASTSEGVPTTLGRGGSDFSAAIVGAALCAARVEIWTDVDGIMTTDPKLCGEARVIRRMSFDEAAELAHFGAKVLHPSTLVPAVRGNIPVFVLNSKRPEREGTEIVARAQTGSIVSAITAKRKVAAVEIVSAQTVDSELLRAVYAVFDQHGCSVDVMATSLGCISLLVGSTAGLPAIAADLRDVAEVRWENHKALVCLVGENIRRQPDVASRVFATVSDMDVRVVCQGASDRTISFLVEESKVEDAVQRLHRIFFPQREPARDWGGTSSAFCQAG
ncbi:MAG: aspartate kinase [Candidatus Sulfotelmatobacter sp.]